jgi:hypothetical protein
MTVVEQLKAAFMFDASKSLFEGINRLLRKNAAVFNRYLTTNVGPNELPSNLTRLRCGTSGARTWDPAEKIVRYIKKVRIN